MVRFRQEQKPHQGDGWHSAYAWKTVDLGLSERKEWSHLIRRNTWEDGYTTEQRRSTIWKTRELAEMLVGSPNHHNAIT